MRKAASMVHRSTRPSLRRTVTVTVVAITVVLLSLGLAVADARRLHYHRKHRRHHHGHHGHISQPPAALPPDTDSPAEPPALPPDVDDAPPPRSRHDRPCPPSRPPSKAPASSPSPVSAPKSPALAKPPAFSVTKPPSPSPAKAPSHSHAKLPALLPAEPPTFPRAKPPVISPARPPPFAHAKAPSLHPHAKAPSFAPANPPTLSPAQPPRLSPEKPPAHAPAKSPTPLHHAIATPPVAAKPPSFGPAKPPALSSARPPRLTPAKPAPTPLHLAIPPVAAKPPSFSPAKPPSQSPAQPPRFPPAKPPAHAPAKSPPPLHHAIPPVAAKPPSLAPAKPPALSVSPAQPPRLSPSKPPAHAPAKPPQPQHPAIPPAEAKPPALPPDMTKAKPPSAIPPASPAAKNSSAACTSVFDVRAFGASGNGSCADDTRAFRAAWKAACSADSATLLVPSDGVFTVTSTVFAGPCKPCLTFQIDGVLMPPDGPASWPAADSRRQWITFYETDGMTLTGTGTIEGNGEEWWNLPCKPHRGPNGSTLPGPCDSPALIRFFASKDVTVQGLRIENSPQFHLKFDACDRVRVDGIFVSSPAFSPNTDGIHVENTRNVQIYNSRINNGDDCVSIGAGCYNVHIENVTCGHGHGISIGSLGVHNTRACVSNVTVRNARILDSDNGLRIKTWQGGAGAVSAVEFAGVRMENVKNCIVIDQYYCLGSGCANQTSAVQVAGVTYRDIHGTYTPQAHSGPVRFACSDSVACTDITMTHVELLPAGGDAPLARPYCWNAYGVMATLTVPPVNCLQEGNPESLQDQLDSC